MDLLGQLYVNVISAKQVHWIENINCNSTYSLNISKLLCIRAGVILERQQNLHYNVIVPRDIAGIYKVICNFNYFISINLWSISRSLGFCERAVTLSYCICLRYNLKILTWKTYPRMNLKRFRKIKYGYLGYSYTKSFIYTN